MLILRFYINAATERVFFHVQVKLLFHFEVEVIYLMHFIVFMFLLNTQVELFTPVLTGIEISVQVFLYYYNTAPSGILMYTFVTVILLTVIYLSAIVLLQSCTKWKW